LPLARETYVDPGLLQKLQSVVPIHIPPILHSQSPDILHQVSFFRVLGLYMDITFYDPFLEFFRHLPSRCKIVRSPSASSVL
jgi:hypothetical protein